MIKFTQRDIDLIGRKIFGEVNTETFDYTVFEFSKYLKSGNMNVIIGQIYRINTPEEYYDIELHFGLMIETRIYIRISYSNEVYHFEMNTITGEIEECD